MNGLPNLNDHELHGTLLNALRLAADCYRDFAKKQRWEEQAFPAMAVTHDGLAEQFDRQAREADELANRLEEESEEAA